MPPSELRKEARDTLKEKWGKSALIILIYTLLSFVYSYITSSFTNNTIKDLLELAWTIITLPIAFGLTISFLKIKRGENVSTFDFFKDGFSRFSRAWGVAWHTFIKMIIPILCIIASVFLFGILLASSIALYSMGSSLQVSHPIIFAIAIILYIFGIFYGIVRGLLYSLSYYIAYDHPEMSTKECVQRSEDLMRGHRGDLFLLELSFIGWAILSIFTLGIGSLWLIPYVIVSKSCFYDRIAKDTSKEVQGTVEIDTESKDNIE